MTGLNLSVAIGRRPDPGADRRQRRRRGGRPGLYAAESPEEEILLSRLPRRPNSTSASCRSRAMRSRRRRVTVPTSRCPALVSRTFRHNAVYVHTDRVGNRADLKGKKVRVRGNQLTANVWARALLDDDYGVTPADIPLDPRRRGQRGAVGKTHRQAAGRRAPGATRGKTATICRPPGASPRDRRLRPRQRPAQPHREGALAHRLAVSRSGRGGQGLLQAHQLFPDHARAGHPPRPGRAAPLLQGASQGVRAGQAAGGRGARGHPSPR